MDVCWTKSAFLYLLTLYLVGVEADPVNPEPMDRSRCEKFANEVIWISRKTSYMIYGKVKNPVDACKLKFGLVSNNTDARLVVTFDFLYIRDCGVEILVNESFDNSFAVSTSNQQLLRSTCNTRVPGPLYARPGYYVLLRLYKTSRDLENFNFRVNVSSVEGLRATGPGSHVVIMAGFVMLVVVCMAISLFFKYLAHISKSLHDRRVGHRMDLAISLYNSQEPIQEPDLVFHQPGHGRDQNQARLRAREPEIAFVHGDGRVERFRPLARPGSHGQELRTESRARPANVRSLITDSDANTSHGRATSNPRDSSSAPSHHGRVRRRLDVLSDTASLSGCELPPSYEEALEMPVPAKPESGSSPSSPAQSAPLECHDIIQSEQSSLPRNQGQDVNVASQKLIQKGVSKKGLPRDTHIPTHEATHENTEPALYVNVCRTNSGASVDDTEGACSSEMPLLPSYDDLCPGSSQHDDVRREDSSK